MKSGKYVLTELDLRVTKARLSLALQGGPIPARHEVTKSPSHGLSQKGKPLHRGRPANFVSVMIVGGNLGAGIACFGLYLVVQ